MELGAGCLACSMQLWFPPSVADENAAVCWQIWNCCFLPHTEHLSFSWFVMFAPEFLLFLRPWQHMSEADLARQPYMASQWLADRWYSSGWHMEIYGFQFVLLFFSPSLLWIWLETLGAHFKESRRLLSGPLVMLVTRESGCTQSHPMDLLKHTAQVLPIYAGFCPMCLFFHFVIGSLP